VVSKTLLILVSSSMTPESRSPPILYISRLGSVNLRGKTILLPTPYKD
jgi:hypothetical protein